MYVYGLPRWLSGEKSACNSGETGSISGFGRSAEGGNGNPLQYSCLENPMDRGAWWATIRGVTRNWTQLGTHICMYMYLHCTCVPTHLHVTIYSWPLNKTDWGTNHQQSKKAAYNSQSTLPTQSSSATDSNYHVSCWTAVFSLKKRKKKNTCKWKSHKNYNNYSCYLLRTSLYKALC